MQQNSRRAFLKKISFAGMATTCLSALDVKAISTANDTGLRKDNLVFLFQGDSITDGNRGRNNDLNHIMGHGYAFSIASRVGADFPEKHLSFLNRGISGNKINDLEARWQKDVLDLKPDVLSILVGVNDVDSVIRKNDEVTSEKFEEMYRVILDHTKRQLPECLLILCEPFILSVGRVKDDWGK